MWSSPARRGICLVIAAPSGAGKSSIALGLRNTEPELRLSVSATTRPPRPGEAEGTHYFFRTLAGFDAMVAGGEMLEWATVFGNRYGTPRAPVEAALAAGLDVVFDIDWQGHRQLRQALPADVVGVFILPPTLGALSDRLLARGGDPAAEIGRRMEAARTEISHWAEFDHIVVNHDLASATAEVRSVLHAARTARKRQTGMPRFVEALMA